MHMMAVVAAVMGWYDVDRPYGGAERCSAPEGCDEHDAEDSELDTDRHDTTWNPAKSMAVANASGSIGPSERTVTEPVVRSTPT